MALISCPRCGRQISSNATHCPQCGEPMQLWNICPECGNTYPRDNKFCPNCGNPNRNFARPMAPNNEQYYAQAPVQNPAPVARPAETQKRKNGMGVAGFVLSLCFICFFYVPVVDVILWFLGLLFSIIGVCKRRARKGLAITGLILSVVSATVVFIVLLIAGEDIFGWR